MLFCRASQTLHRFLRKLEAHYTNFCTSSSHTAQSSAQATQISAQDAQAGRRQKFVQTCVEASQRVLVAQILSTLIWSATHHQQSWKQHKQNIKLRCAVRYEIEKESEEWNIVCYYSIWVYSIMTAAWLARSITYHTNDIEAYEAFAGSVASNISTHALL